MAKVHKGDLAAKAGVVYDCAEITGYLYAGGADTTTAFPALTTPNDPTAAAKVAAAFRAKGFEWHDGILSVVVRRRGPVSVVQVVGSTKQSYVVTDGDHTAHGDTLAEARADLRFKRGPRDATPYRSWTPETVVSREDAVVAYRVITGACAAGVRQFLAGRKVPAKLSVARILTETAGQFGHDAFARFMAKWAA